MPQISGFSSLGPIFWMNVSLSALYDVISFFFILLA